MQALQGRLRGLITPGLSSGEKTAPAQPGGLFRNGVLTGAQMNSCIKFQSPLGTGYGREEVNLIGSNENR